MNQDVSMVLATVLLYLPMTLKQYLLLLQYGYFEYKNVVIIIHC